MLEGELAAGLGTHDCPWTRGRLRSRNKGVPHTFYAEAGGARALVGFAPMQFEGFQREVGQPAPERVLPPPLEGPPDVARLIPIAKRNGFEGSLVHQGPPPGR